MMNHHTTTILVYFNLNVNTDSSKPAILILTYKIEILIWADTGACPFKIENS